MGRYNGNSGSDSNVSGMPIISTSMPAGAAIQRGDLVLLGGTDNKCYPAAYPNDSNLDKFLRPTAGSPETWNRSMGARQIAPSYAVDGTGYENYDVVKLTNGRILVAFAMADGLPGFAIYDADANPVGVPSAVANPGGGAVSGTGGNFCVSAIALPNGGFAIGYVVYNNSNYVTCVAVYDADGNQTVAPFKVYTTATTTYAARIARLSNGNIVAAMKIDKAAWFAIFKTDGTQVVAATVVGSDATAAQGDRSIGVIGLVGGGFVVAYVVVNSGGGSKAWSRQYDNAGVALSQSATSLSPNTGNNPPGFVYPVALVGGGYAIGAVVANGSAYLSIFAASGGMYAQINLGAPKNTMYGNFMSVAGLPNGNVGISWISGTVNVGLMAAVYSPTGTAVVAPQNIEGDPAANMTGGMLTFGDDNNAFIACSVNGKAKVYVLNNQLSLITSWVSSYPTVSMGKNVVIGLTSIQANLPAYVLVNQQTTQGMLTIFSNVIRRQGLTLIGVSTNIAAKDEQVGVQMTGITSLRRAFEQPWMTNQQGTTPPGQRAYAVGATAVLSGIQPSAPSQIN